MATKVSYQGFLPYPATTPKHKLPPIEAASKPLPIPKIPTTNSAPKQLQAGQLSSIAQAFMARVAVVSEDFHFAKEPPDGTIFFYSKYGELYSHNPKGNIYGTRLNGLGMPKVINGIRCVEYIKLIYSPISQAASPQTAMSSPIDVGEEAYEASDVNLNLKANDIVTSLIEEKHEERQQILAKIVAEPVTSTTTLQVLVRVVRELEILSQESDKAWMEPVATQILKAVVVSPASSLSLPPHLMEPALSDGQLTASQKSIDQLPSTINTENLKQQNSASAQVLPPIGMASPPEQYIDKVVQASSPPVPQSYAVSTEPQALTPFDNRTPIVIAAWLQEVDTVEEISERVTYFVAPPISNTDTAKLQKIANVMRELAKTNSWSIKDAQTNLAKITIETLGAAGLVSVFNMLTTNSTDYDNASLAGSVLATAIIKRYEAGTLDDKALLDILNGLGSSASLKRDDYLYYICDALVSSKQDIVKRNSTLKYLLNNVAGSNVINMVA